MFDLEAMPFLGDTRPPVQESAIRRAEEELGLVIPDVYKDLLRVSDGANTDYVCFYAAEDLAERNELCEVKEYAPGYLAIGCDNSGMQLLMRAQADAQEVRLVDSGVVEPSANDVVLPSLYRWLMGTGGDPGDPMMR